MIRSVLLALTLLVAAAPSFAGRQRPDSPVVTQELRLVDYAKDKDSDITTAVPEPGAGLLFALGLGLCIAYTRKA